jgi:hypothetical protein
LHHIEYLVIPGGIPNVPDRVVVWYVFLVVHNPPRRTSRLFAALEVF